LASYDQSGLGSSQFRFELLASGRLAMAMEDVSSSCCHGNEGDPNGNLYDLNTPVGSISTNVEYRAAVVRSSDGSVDLYVNGTLMGSAAAPSGGPSDIYYATKVFAIGSRKTGGGWSNGDYFQGTIADAVFVNEAIPGLALVPPPPAPPAPPRLPPPALPQPVASIEGDPHIVAHGGSADFHGEDARVFNLLSVSNFSLNALFQEQSFTSSFSRQRVNGSFIKAAFWTIRNSQLWHVSFFSEVAVVKDAQMRAIRVVKHGAPPFTAEDLSVSVSGRTATVRTRRWSTTAQSRWAYPHAGIVRIHIHIQPRYDAARGVVAPHGVLGQTYDGDRAPLFGREDDDRRAGHSSRATTAQAEGFIQGVWSEYKVGSPFATAFRYSRFSESRAPPRDAAALRTLGMLILQNATSGADIRWGVNLVGADLEGLYSARSPLRCFYACKERRRCVAFTFILARTFRPCWLKRKGYVAQTNAACVSGLMPGMK